MGVHAALLVASRWHQHKPLLAFSLTGSFSCSFLSRVLIRRSGLSIPLRFQKSNDVHSSVRDPTALPRAVVDAVHAEARFAINASIAIGHLLCVHSLDASFAAVIVGSGQMFL